ncbi:MAG TPA: hypothetical protein VJ826_13185 [Candidatus Polarisedimenticolaceae bacterium]|nr:hypothetical protein [Candidatus Polarisedimenticolaceae bacterium]
MSAHDISPAVRQLIAEGIDSIAELEGVLLLREHRDRDWTAEDAGARLYVSVAVASHVLSVLAARGFLAESAGRYRYAPETPDIEEAVSALAVCYPKNLIAVTQLVHAKPAQSVRQFARAFRLRKDG